MVGFRLGFFLELEESLDSVSDRSLFLNNILRFGSNGSSSEEGFSSEHKRDNRDRDDDESQRLQYKPNFSMNALASS